VKAGERFIPPRVCKHPKIVRGRARVAESGLVPTWRVAITRMHPLSTLFGRINHTRKELSICSKCYSSTACMFMFYHHQCAQVEDSACCATHCHANGVAQPKQLSRHNRHTCMSPVQSVLVMVLCVCDMYECG